jgi:thiol-disulfide isomerase/thioredoxin
MLHETSTFIIVINSTIEARKMTFSKTSVSPALLALLLFSANGCMSGNRVKVESALPGVIVESTEYLSRLVGKPAPGFEKIKAWKNTRPLNLSDLRGRYVLLDFWGYWCGPCIRDIPALMAISEVFSEEKLIVIGVHDDSVETIAEMDEKLAKAREGIWMGRDIPYPVALDGGGPTAIEGTSDTVRGATTAAYGITAFPTAVLINPSGKVVGRFHAPSLDEKIAELEQLLGVQAKKPAWQRRFEAAYRLERQELLRHISLPYPSERMDFFWRQFSRWGWFYFPNDQMPHIPESAILTWNERKRQIDGGMNADNLTILEVLTNFGFREWEFQGDLQMLQRQVTGDWVKREEAQRGDLLAQFERILRKEIGLPIRFIPDEVERDVFIATGRFEFHPISTEYGDNIALFVEKPDPPDNIRGGGGSGDFNSFLDYVSRLINIHIINKGVSNTGENLQWRQHSTAEISKLRTNTALIDVFLEYISKQTSLRFQRDRQREHIWLIKTDK